MVDIGIALPPIPTMYNNKYPYVTIFGTSANAGTTVLCRLTAHKMVFIPKSLNGGYNDALLEIGLGYIDYELNLDSFEWILVEGCEDEAASSSIFEGTIDVCAASYDILTVTSVDENRNPTEVGDEVYFSAWMYMDGYLFPQLPDNSVETYPYFSVYAIYQESALVGYAILLTKGEHIFVPNSVRVQHDGDHLFCFSDGGFAMYVCQGAEWQIFIAEETGSFESSMILGGMTLNGVVANHDVKILTGQDSETGETIYSDEEMYLLDCTVTYPELLSAPGTWFKGMADATRRMTCVTKRYTTDEMLDILEKTSGGKHTPITVSGFADGNSANGSYFKNLTDVSVETVAAGKTYLVNWDDVDYRLVAASLEDGVVMLGNSAVAIGGGDDDTGEPFCIVCMVTESMGITALYSSGTDDAHTFSIAELP